MTRERSRGSFAALSRFLLLLFFLSGCGGGGGGGGGGSSTPSTPTVYKNQIVVQLLSSQLNIPTVSVTLCVPGTSTCQTVGNILLDTASVGLRISHNALSISLPQVTDGSSEVFECYNFSSSDTFGPVVSADVTLGGEPAATNLELQVSNHNLNSPSSCTPSTITNSGVNGILGVGYPFAQYDAGNYYDCPAIGCAPGTATLSCSRLSNPSSPCQVANPVFSFPTDNNGVTLSLPPVPEATGSPSPVYGVLTFGIRTQSDNTLSGLTTYTVDTSSTSGCGSSDYLDASFTGGASGSCAFLDSGSNGLFFGTTTFPLCGGGNWYCPSASPSSVYWSVTGANGATGRFTLNVLSETTIAQSGNIAWSDLAGPYGSNGTFDAGLPFFFGRTVAVGYQTGGQTPYWAF
ncbi:MAG: DUF3443 family protein [Leptospirillia bacterium]